MPGVPVGGFKTIGQITPTNAFRFRPDQDCISIATELLQERGTGGPVVDHDGKFIGFISEIDPLRALRAGYGSQSA
ncbi:MAG: hypothetical protein C4294_02035 [Nitrospiraceae bacterium]